MKSRIPLSSSQRRAIKEEISRQIVESDKQHFKDYDSLVLYTLMVEFGFGKRRLKRFYDAFHQNYEELKDHYCMGDEDVPFICTVKLKQIGVNLDEWDSSTCGNK